MMFPYKKNWTTSNLGRKLQKNKMHHILSMYPIQVVLKNSQITARKAECQHINMSVKILGTNERTFQMEKIGSDILPMLSNSVYCICSMSQRTHFSRNANRVSSLLS